MQNIELEASAHKSEASSSQQCPIDHSALSQQKTVRGVEPVDRPIERDADGVWHVRGFDEARAVLRSGNTQQAGFKADLLARLPRKMKSPILYQEGKAHQQQRKQTARFFTPKAVSSNYRQLMETLVDQLIKELQDKKRADLSKLSMVLAIRVAGEVVGLTNSLLPGITKRLDAFFEHEIDDFSWHPQTLMSFVGNQWRIASFFLLDVKPAIQARRRNPREDVISHLLAQGYNDGEILTECVTYAAAGMVTTREFISVAAWHLLEQPALRARYLVASEEERQVILQEVLRLEPVVGNLYRRATADIHLESQGAHITLPQGELLNIHVHGANADESVVGEQPLALCPGRELKGDHIPSAVMAFGDGHHRCPGSYIAIQEADIFLQRLLALDSLRIERTPKVNWNELVTGYELRKFMLVLD